MTVETETITVAGVGLTVDLIVWRRHRRRIPGLVEQVLDINPGLAALGEHLPIGTVVQLPVIVPTPAAKPAETVIRLWD